jgi:hypothetical protein
MIAKFWIAVMGAAVMLMAGSSLSAPNPALRVALPSVHLELS